MLSAHVCVGLRIRGVLLDIHTPHFTLQISRRKDGDNYNICVTTHDKLILKVTDKSLVRPAPKGHTPKLNFNLHCCLLRVRCNFINIIIRLRPARRNPRFRVGRCIRLTNDYYRMNLFNMTEVPILIL